MIIGMIWVNLTYVQPYGSLGEGRKYCNALAQEGYFESRDTAYHENCIIGYEPGKNKDKKYWTCSYDTGCFSYDDYDEDCELEIDMKDFGRRCVWGGLGWMATGLTIMLWGMVIMFLVVLLMLVLVGGKK